MPSEVFKLFLWKSALPGKCSICIFLTYTSYGRLSVVKIIFANISGVVYASAGALGKKYIPNSFYSLYNFPIYSTGSREVSPPKVFK